MAIKPKFIQIVIGGWESSDNKLMHSVYGLSEKGNVYKFEKKRGGWIPIEDTKVASDPKPQSTPKSFNNPPESHGIMDDDVPF